MKRIVNCCLLVLLALGGSCKKPLELVEVGEPPLPPEGCRIVKETYWNPDANPSQTQVIEAEGKKYTVNRFTVINYFYNQKGQVIREQFENNEKYYTTYEYKADSIIKTQMLLIDGKGILPVQTVIRLNTTGLDASKQYDAEGYPIGPFIPGIEVVRENGNIITQTTRPNRGGWLERVDYEYNPNRPNLPNIYPFLGKANKNLMVKHIKSSPDIDIYKAGELYRVNYYYQYDRLGRVKRLIRVGKDEKNSGWPYVSDSGHIGVFDYEYECN